MTARSGFTRYRDIIEPWLVAVQINSQSRPLDGSQPPSARLDKNKKCQLEMLLLQTVNTYFWHFNHFKSQIRNISLKRMLINSKLKMENTQ